MDYQNISRQGNNMPDLSQSLLTGMYGIPQIDAFRQLSARLGRSINPQFGFGGFSSAGPLGGSGAGGFGGFGAGPNRGPRLHHDPPPPGILPSQAHNALDWLVGHIKGGPGGAAGHISMEDANQLIRGARQGYLGFDPTGMMVQQLDPSTDPGNRGWMNFGIDPNRARQVAHAQRAIQLLQQIQQKHGGTRQQRGYSA